MFPLSFKISSVPSRQIVSDLLVNVAEDHHSLLYVGKAKPTQVVISYVGMPEPSANDIEVAPSNEAYGDVSIIENSFLTRYARRNTDKVFDMPLRNVLITDVLASDESTERPLFYKHVISSGGMSSVEILDLNMEPVFSDSWKLLVSDEEIAVYHDLRPEIDQESGRTILYYIRYVNEDGIPIFSLLENTPVFRAATLFDDNFQRQRLFTVRKVGPKYRYRILYQGAGPFYTRPTEEGQIKILKPLVAQSKDPWYLEVTDGELVGKFGAERFLYSLPEYHSQAFDPVEPVFYHGTQECLPLTETLVKIPFGNLIIDREHPISLLVTDSTFHPRVGYTTSTDEEDAFWIDKIYRRRFDGTTLKAKLLSATEEGVSFNKTLGIAHLPIELNPEDLVFVRAHSELRTMKYLGLNVNPLHNRAMLDHRAVLYVLPEAELSETRQGLQHLLLDKLDTITGWSDPRLGDDELIESLNPTFDRTGYSNFLENNPHVLILGTVMVNRNANINDLLLIDMRRKGGVLTPDIESELPSLLETYAELQWISDDSVAGRALPLLGVSTVDVPFRLTEKGGGVFSQGDIETIVNKHLALGSLPLINHYADTPLILDALFSHGFDVLGVSWREVGDTETYRIFFSNDARGPFSYLDVTGIAHDVFPNVQTAAVYFGNSATPDTEFVPEQKIYVKVAPLINGEEWPSSAIVEVTLNIAGGASLLRLEALLASPPVLGTSLSAQISEAA